MHEITQAEGVEQGDRAALGQHAGPAWVRSSGRPMAASEAANWPRNPFGRAWCCCPWFLLALRRFVDGHLRAVLARHSGGNFPAGLLSRAFLPFLGGGLGRLRFSRFLSSIFHVMLCFPFVVFATVSLLSFSLSLSLYPFLCYCLHSLFSHAAAPTPSSPWTSSESCNLAELGPRVFGKSRRPQPPCARRAPRSPRCSRGCRGQNALKLGAVFRKSRRPQPPCTCRAPRTVVAPTAVVGTPRANGGAQVRTLECQAAAAPT